MRTKRTVCVLLAACLLLSLVPGAVRAAGSNPDPVYSRAAGPEVALFNNVTGNNADFYKSVQSSSRYNAVAKGYFGTLKYDTKVSGQHLYQWNGFAGSTINAMRQKSTDIQIGYSVTRTSKYHKHTSGIYYWKMTSWSDTTLGFNTGGIAGAGLINYWGYRQDQDTFRQGNNKFHTWIPQTAKLDLVFNPDIIKYDDNSKVCSCGGTSEGCMVCFYDGTAPYLERIEIRDQDGNFRTNFKPGDTVNILLICSEDVRFSDDRASGKGNIYIGFRINRTSDYIYAHLTKLDGKTLTFSYKVDENDHSLYDIASINLKKAPDGGQPLLSDSASFDLWMLQGNERFQVTKPSNADANGYTKTTSCITDIAGNPLYMWGGDPTNVSRPFYIDGEAPKVVAVDLSAVTNNADVKEALNKTTMDPGDPKYNDHSDTYLGVGDKLIVKAYLNEVVTGGRVYLTTNIKQADGTYLEFWGFSGYNSISAEEVNLGSQYGLGASNGYIALVNCGSATIENGMTVDDAEGKIKVTSVRYSNVSDKSGNTANGTENKLLEPNQQYILDTVAPTATAQDVNQANRTDYGFYATFQVQDNVGGSGVEGMPGYVTLGGGSLIGAFKYAVIGTPAPDDKTVWLDGMEGTPAPFTQSGGVQYLHVQSIDGEAYDVSKLIFTLSDYAGNRAATTEVNVTGVGFDSVGPTILGGNTTRAYDNAGFGTMTATINVNDPSKVKTVQYQWNDGTELTAESTGWIDAVGTLDKTGVTMTATATVDSGDAFKKTLWVKAEDDPGNVTVTSLGEYSYSLAGIQYSLEYSTAILTELDLVVQSVQSSGAVVIEAKKPGDDTHYITICSTASGLPDHIFKSIHAHWFTADYETTGDGGYKFTNLVSVSNPFAQDSFSKHVTGNVQVTVYSGVMESDIIRGDNYASWKEDSTADVVFTTNAKSESFTLRVSYVHNYNLREEVFTKFDFSISPMIAGFGSLTGLWNYDETTQFGPRYNIHSSEEVQIHFDLGEDVNGWDFEYIDWDNSYIELQKGSEGEAFKACGIGYGPCQTITLPALNLESGYYHVSVMLARYNAPSWSHYYNGGSIYIDATEPGTVDLGMLAKEERYGGALVELTYDPTETIYIPTSDQCYLNVNVLDPDGTLHESTNPTTYLKCGECAVIAWNVADPDQRVVLQRKYMAENEGVISFDNTEGLAAGSRRLLELDLNYDSYNYSSGTYTHVNATKVDKGILGLEEDQDNIVAFQARYANGRASEITYVTIHPVSIKVSGTVTTDPGFYNPGYTLHDYTRYSGMTSVDPGQANIVFTPGEGSNMTGLTLYCQESYSYTGHHGSDWYFDGFDPVPGAEVMEMTLQSDGTYTAAVPTKAETNLTEQLQTCARGSYLVYAVDVYGNRVDLGANKVGIIADGAAPVVAESSLTVEDGMFTATYKIYDDSLYSWWHETSVSPPAKVAQSRPMQLTLSYNEDYAAIIGASDTLTLTDVCDGFVWTNDGPNPMGICEVTASITRDGSFQLYTDNNTQYLKCPTDTYMTVTVKGVIGPNASNTDMTLNLSAADAHGNLMEPVGVTETVSGVQPAVTEAVYQRVEPDSASNYDRALYLTFNTPVQPEETWINRSIEGYETQWHDAFPIWKDGEWILSFTDLFGTRYDLPITLTDVFGEYGFDLSFSTLDYVAAREGVTLFYEADTDNEAVYYDDTFLSYTFCDNGDYALTRDADGETDLLPIHLNNIVSGGPEETLYFYLDEFKEQYIAGSPEQYQGTTTAPVTVSYRTSRDTSPVGDTKLTFMDGDNDTFTFRYYDAATDFTYTITGKLSDYGITLAAPPQPYQDTDPPLIELVTIWKQRAGGYVQTDAFPGSANDAAVLAAIEASGSAQGYDFVVSASDYSKWKVVVKSAEPTEMSYATASSDAIPGVTVQGNNVLVSKDVASDFWIVVVDNAKTDSAATADNFSFVKVPFGSYSFDTTAPVIETLTVATGLYAKTVYIKAIDTDDQGHDNSAGVTVSGYGVLDNHDAGYAEYPYKVIFTDNDAVVHVTVIDAAGNSTTSAIQVTGIDTSTPTLSTSWSPCYQDPATGKLDQSNPTTGPVNTPVTAHITSDKPIADVKASFTSWWSAGPEEYDFNDPNGAWWGSVEFTSQRVTVRFNGDFYPEDDVDLTLTIYAPNGKSSTVDLRMNGGVFDTKPPVLYAEEFEYLYRDGYSVPYAATFIFRPDYGEKVRCTTYGPSDVWYYYDMNGENDLEVTVNETSEEVFVFTDRAGNSSKAVLPNAESNWANQIWDVPDADMLAEIDSTAPRLKIELPDDASAANSAVTATVTVNEECTLSSDSSDITCGALTKTTDNEGNTVWTATLTADTNGTFRVTATDLAGNATTTVFTVHNVDKTLPIIGFITTTVKLRQDSTDQELQALLEDGVTTWDNVEIQDGSLAFDVSGVRLDTLGVYAVTYTVEDTVGNVGQATRYVKVIDKNQPIVTVDDFLTEQNGVTTIKTGDHILSVDGLRAPNEPYKLTLVQGIWSYGQLKLATGGITVGKDGKFRVDSPGFYTLYIVTQSRQTYRIILYVEN